MNEVRLRSNLALTIVVIGWYCQRAREGCEDAHHHADGRKSCKCELGKWRGATVAVRTTTAAIAA